MFHRDHRIYTSAPLRQLADAQMRAILPDLQRSAGTHALSLGVRADDVVPPMPMIGCWVQVWVATDGYRGDVCAAIDAPVPFLDDAFGVVLLRHALEAVASPSVLLGEAMRVLAPGGLLVLTGVHPVSGWAPWFYWRSRDPQALPFPAQLGRRLQRRGLEVEWTRRVGRPWPSDAGSQARPFNPCGGGYVLLARKRSRSATPLRLLPAPLRVGNGSLSAGTRRSAVLIQRHSEQR